jgi:hypothetical protein
MSTAAAWDRFAYENYGVSGDELSASLLLDLYDHLFEKIRRGESVNLPSRISKILHKNGIISIDKGPHNKRMVNWEKYDKLHEIRNKIG